jgi:cell division protein FtsB
MTQDKMRRIITASAVAATLLLVFLLSFLIYQWVQIAVYNKRIENLEKETARLEQKLDENIKDAEYYESIFGKEWLAFQNGFVRPSEE